MSVNLSESEKVCGLGPALVAFEGRTRKCPRRVVLLQRCSKVTLPTLGGSLIVSLETFKESLKRQNILNRLDTPFGETLSPRRIQWGFAQPAAVEETLKSHYRAPRDPLRKSKKPKPPETRHTKAQTHFREAETAEYSAHKG